MKSFKTHIEENKDHVETHMDVMVPDSHDTPSKAKKWISNYVQKKGGPSNKLSHYTYDGPGGGHPAVSVKGHVSHVMKLHNHHNDEKFSHDHEGHKKMSKEYGFDKDKNHLMKRESVTQTPGDSYHHLQKAKRMASADGHDYDKLPKYHRGKDVPHQAHYDDKAKNEAMDNKTFVKRKQAAADKRMAQKKMAQKAADTKSKAMGMYSSPLANPGMSFVGYRSKFD